MVPQSRAIRRLIRLGVVSGSVLASYIWAGTGPTYKLGNFVCGGLNCVPPNSRVEALPPNVVVFEDGVVRRQSDSDEIMRVGLVSL